MFFRVREKVQEKTIFLGEEDSGRKGYDVG